MLTIILKLSELKQSIYSYIDNVIHSNLDYCELYIKPSKTDLYIKVKDNYYNSLDFNNRF